MHDELEMLCRQLKPLLPGGKAPGNAPEAGSLAPAGGSGWDKAHTARLQALVAQHAQLLATTFSMATQTPGNDRTAGQAGQMLHALQVSMPDLSRSALPFSKHMFLALVGERLLCM